MRLILAQRRRGVMLRQLIIAFRPSLRTGAFGAALEEIRIEDTITEVAGAPRSSTSKQKKNWRDR
jgi:hypothetical protein